MKKIQDPMAEVETDDMDIDTEYSESDGGYTVGGKHYKGPIPVGDGTIPGLDDDITEDDMPETSPKVNNEYIDMKMADSRDKMRRTTYKGHGPIGKAYLATCYAVGAKTPEGVLTNKLGYLQRRIVERNGDEKKIQEAIGKLEKRQDGLDKKGKVVDKKTQRKMKEAFQTKIMAKRIEYKELKTALRKENDEVVELRSAYYNAPDTDDGLRDKSESAEAIASYTDSIQQKKARMRRLQDELGNAASGFNMYFELVRQDERSKKDLQERLGRIRDSKRKLQTECYLIARMISDEQDKVGISEMDLAKRLAGDGKAIGEYGEIRQELENINDNNREVLNSLPSAQRDVNDDDFLEEDDGDLSDYVERQIDLAVRRINSDIPQSV